MDRQPRCPPAEASIHSVNSEIPASEDQHVREKMAAPAFARVGVVQNAAKLWNCDEAYDPATVERIYSDELTNPSSKKALEFSQFLENYLWPNFVSETSSKGHLISIVSMVNEKFRERIPAWRAFLDKPKEFSGFFRRVLRATIDDTFQFSIQEQTSLLVFLMHCFNSVEVRICARTQRP